jgi:hypothetical protein
MIKSDVVGREETRSEGSIAGLLFFFIYINKRHEKKKGTKI